MGAAPASRDRLVTFAELIEAWLAAGCPNVAPSRSSRHVRERSAKTQANARQLLRANVKRTIGDLVVDRTTTARLEALFADMAELGKSTSTIDHSWAYLNQACHYGIRTHRTKSNPASGVLLPAKRPSTRPRRSFTIAQVETLITESIPADPRPAMWLTGLMCGLRPGELAGLRWPFVDIDAPNPTLAVTERAVEVDDVYVGQASPKTERGRRTLALHPLVVAALVRHREEQRARGVYGDEGFVFATRNGTPMTMSNMRRAFQSLCVNAGLGGDWTTYELRHSFVSLVATQLDDLNKVADLAGHVDQRTTQGYRHPVRPSLPHAIEAWNRLLANTNIDASVAADGNRST